MCSIAVVMIAHLIPDFLLCLLDRPCLSASALPVAACEACLYLSFRVVMIRSATVLFIIKRVLFISVDQVGIPWLCVHARIFFWVHICD